MSDGGNGNGSAVQLTAKDFKSDQEVRWCPGCGEIGRASCRERV